MKQSSTGNRQHKREQFAHNSARVGRRTAFLLVVLAVAIIGLAYLLFGRNTTSTAVAHFSGGDVRIRLSDIGSEAKFFEYKTAGAKLVRFFVIRSSDGVYRAAADACEVCYRSKLGYQQQGDDMVCRNCGRHFPSKDVNVVTGGCNPSGIQVTRQGDNLVIAAADLDTHATLF